MWEVGNYRMCWQAAVRLCGCDGCSAANVNIKLLGKALLCLQFFLFYWQRVLGGWAFSRRRPSTGMERLRELVLWSNCRLLSWAQHALTSTRYLTLNDDVPDTKEAIYIILDAKNLLTVLRFGLCWHQHRPCSKTKWGTIFAGRCYRKSKIL